MTAVSSLVAAVAARATASPRGTDISSTAEDPLEKTEDEPGRPTTTASVATTRGAPESVTATRSTTSPGRRAAATPGTPSEIGTREAACAIEVDDALPAAGAAVGGLRSAPIAATVAIPALTEASSRRWRRAHLRGPRPTEGDQSMPATLGQARSDVEPLSTGQGQELLALDPDVELDEPVLVELLEPDPPDVLAGEDELPDDSPPEDFVAVLADDSFPVLALPRESVR